jgi:hypothetical protein
VKINVKRPPSLSSLSKPSPQKEIQGSDRGQMFVYLGPPGSGKTSYAAEHPNPYFVIEEKETGVLDLIDAGRVNLGYESVNRDIKSWMDLSRFNEEVLSDSFPFPQKVDTIIYESISGFEQECHRYCCANRYNNNWDSTRKGFMFYQEGYRVAAKEFWSQFVLQLCRLRETGYNIVLTGHTQKITEKNIDDVDFMAAAGACQASTMDVTSPYFQNIFFIDQDIDAKKENEQAKGKIVQVQKKLFVNWSPYRKAVKNRYGITEDLLIDGMNPKQMYDTFCKVAKLDPKTLRHLPRKG